MEGVRFQFSLATLAGVCLVAVPVGLGVVKWIVDSGIDYKTAALIIAAIVAGIAVALAKSQTL